MTVIRAALDEMFAVIGQMVSSVFRHGLPLTDKIAARTALTNFFLHIHPVRVRRSWIRMSYTLCLGGLSFFLFIVLTVTGLFLMFYYVPRSEERRVGKECRFRLCVCREKKKRVDYSHGLSRLFV